MIEAIFDLLGTWVVGYWQEAIAYIGLALFLAGIITASFALAASGFAAMIVGGLLMRRKWAERK